MYFAKLGMGYLLVKHFRLEHTYLCYLNARCGMSCSCPSTWPCPFPRHTFAVKIYEYVLVCVCVTGQRLA